jgi:HAE1 family hydrophobic/amphiphilic exporter-1
MLIGTLFGVFVIPVLFILFQGLQERVSGPPKQPVADDALDNNQAPIAKP